jgi:hypothetical protein
MTIPSENWGRELLAAVCEHCDWCYLLAPDSLPITCPHCFNSSLSPMPEEIDQLPYIHPPELVQPFALSQEQLTTRLKQFARGIPLAPPDLSPERLTSRLQRVFLPRWLVDAEVEATWQAETGFNYDIVSHEEQFDENQGDWRSKRVTQSRVRWEPRLGRLRRTYHNVPAPALEEALELKQRLGDYDAAEAQPYQPQALSGVLVRLPSRAPDDAWPEARPALRVVAGEECRRASEADHIRDFRWTATYVHQHWTQLLLPLYTTYYLDDDSRPRRVLVNGQTGRLSGVRRASTRRARRLAVAILAAAAAIFSLSLILAIFGAFFVSSLVTLAGLGLILALLTGLVAILPIAIVWQFNQAQREP